MSKHAVCGMNIASSSKLNFLKEFHQAKTKIEKEVKIKKVKTRISKITRG